MLDTVGFLDMVSSNWNAALAGKQGDERLLRVMQDGAVGHPGSGPAAPIGRNRHGCEQPPTDAPKTDSQQNG